MPLANRCFYYYFLFFFFLHLFRTSSLCLCVCDRRMHIFELLMASIFLEDLSFLLCFYFGVYMPLSHRIHPLTVHKFHFILVCFSHPFCCAPALMPLIDICNNVGTFYNHFVFSFFHIRIFYAIDFWLNTADRWKEATPQLHILCPIYLYFAECEQYFLFMYV